MGPLRNICCGMGTATTVAYLNCLASLLSFAHVAIGPTIVKHRPFIAGATVFVMACGVGKQTFQSPTHDVDQAGVVISASTSSSGGQAVTILVQNPVVGPDFEAPLPESPRSALKST